MLNNSTIRLFVSSTFNDMKAERDILQREVFPKLQQLCLSKGLRFQAIDLRWGVSEEAGKDNRTMRICLRELKRCQESKIKPNFLVLLGDRYGWRPLPEIIPADLFEALRIEIDSKELKSRNILDEWYRQDDNSVPPVYELQPRTGRFDDFDIWNSEVELPLLAALERASETLLPDYDNSAALRDILSGIGTSATEQEIHHGALALPPDEVQQHVHAFSRTIINAPTPPHPDFIDCRPDGSADIRFRDRLVNLKLRLDKHIGGETNFHDYSVPWREAGCFTDSDLATFSDSVFNSLRQVIDRQIASLEDIPPEVQEENAHRAFAAERRAGFVGRDVPLARIADYLAYRVPFELFGHVPNEYSLNDEKDRIQAAIRITERKLVQEGHRKGSQYAYWQSNCLLAIAGSSGSGKSALIAEASAFAAVLNPNAVIITLFIGITPGSSNLITLLSYMVNTIRRKYPKAKKSKDTLSDDQEAQMCEGPPHRGETSVDIDTLIAAFKEALGCATAKRPLWIFIDAIDQFTPIHNITRLDWIPFLLPKNVRIIVSTTTINQTQSSSSDNEDDLPSDTTYSLLPKKHGRFAGLTSQVYVTLASQVWSDLKSRSPAAIFIMLNPVALSEGERMLDQWLSTASRKLQPNQQKILLDAFVAEGNALWLHVATEEALRWRSWHTPQTPPANLPALLEKVMVRLSRPQEHGGVMTQRALSYLVTARHGLAEDELIDILGADPVVMSDVIARSPTERAKAEANRIKTLPVAIWVRLHGDIAFYLSERLNQGAALFGFYHRSFGETVERIYLPDHQARLPLHETMARWFGDQPWFMPSVSVTSGQKRKPKRTDPPNTRKTSELPYHLYQVAELNPDTDLWNPLVDVLCSLDCVETKARSELLYELVSDYNAALAALPEFRDENKIMVRRDKAMIAYNKALQNYACQRYSWLQGNKNGEGINEPIYPARPAILDEYLATLLPEEHSERAAKIRHFSNFLFQHLELLTNHKDYLLPMAFNYSDANPVSEEAEKMIEIIIQPWLRLSPRPHVQFTTQCLQTFIGHSGLVKSVSFSTDRQSLLSGSYDQTIRLWDKTSGACLREIHDSGFVTSVCFSPDGERALSACIERGNPDHPFRLWHLRSGFNIRCFNGHSDNVNSICFSPDGATIISGSDDRSIGVWDLAFSPFRGNWLCDSIGKKYILKGHCGAVRCVSFSPDGKHVLSGSDDCTIRLWNIETYKLLGIFKGHSDSVRSVCFSPDGRFAISASADKTLKLWEVSSGDCLATLKGHSASVLSVCFSPDGQYALSGSADKTMRIWCLQSITCIATVKGHCDSVRCVSFSPEGRDIASGSDDLTIKLWNVASIKRQQGFSGICSEIRSLSVIENGQRALTGHEDHTVGLWNVMTNTCIQTLKAHEDVVLSVSASFNGSKAVSGGRDYTIRFWDLKSGICTNTFQDHTNWVTSVSMNFDGRFAISASLDRTLRYWDSESCCCLHTLKGHGSGVVSVSITPDMLLAVSGSQDCTLKIWDLSAGSCLRTLEGHNKEIIGVCLSPEGRRAISWSADRTIRLWDLISGKCFNVIPFYDYVASSVCFSHDGSFVITGHSDKVIRIWDLKSNTCLLRYPMGRQIRAIATMPSGKLIVVCTGDNQIQSFSIEKLPQAGPAIVTAINLRSVSCPYCSCEFPMPPQIASIIHTNAASLLQSQRPSLDLSADAFDNDRLLFKCPSCGETLRFNPFCFEGNCKFQVKRNKEV